MNDDPKPTLLYPVVWWLTQDKFVSHEASLKWIFEYFNNSARRYLLRCDPRNREDSDADMLVFLALGDLQRMVVGQYLPRLSVGSRKGVNCIWPWWDETGIQVVLENGIVDAITEPFPPHEAKETKEFKHGGRYELTFYRSEESGQREQWFRHVMMGRAEKERPRKLLKEESFDEPTWQAGQRTSLVVDRAHRSRLEEILAIVDSSDREASKGPKRDLIDHLRTEKSRKSKQKLDELRQEKCRATRRIRTARTIIQRASSDAVAKSFYDRLKKCPDGDRHVDLKRYFDRYLTPDAAA